MKFSKSFLILLFILLPYKSLNSYAMSASQAAMDKALLACEQAAMAIAYKIAKKLHLSDGDDILNRKPTKNTDIFPKALHSLKSPEWILCNNQKDLYSAINQNKIEAMSLQMQKEERERYSKFSYKISVIPEHSQRIMPESEIYARILSSDLNEARNYLNIVDNFCNQLINITLKNKEEALQILFNLTESLGPTQGPLYEKMQHILTQILNQICNSDGKIENIDFNYDIQKEIIIGLNEIYKTRAVNKLKEKFHNNGEWIFSENSFEDVVTQCYKRGFLKAKEINDNALQNGTNYKNYNIISQFKNNVFNKEFVSDVSYVNNLTAELNYKKALDFLNDSNINTTKKEWRRSLIRERFDDYGILRKFANDPVWKNLLTEDKKLITTGYKKLENGKTRLNTLNSTLVLRHSSKIQIASEFMKSGDIANITPEVDDILYKLLDNHSDMTKQIELLCNIAKKDINSNTYNNFFSENGILKCFEDNKLINDFRLNKSLPKELKSSIVVGINKAIFASENNSKPQKEIEKTLAYIKRANGIYNSHCAKQAEIYLDLSQAIAKCDYKKDLSLLETLFLGNNRKQILKLTQEAAQKLDQVNPKKVSRLSELRLEILHSNNNGSTAWFKMVDNPDLTEKQNQELFLEVQELLEIHINEKNLRLINLSAQYLSVAKNAQNEQLTEAIRAKYNPNCKSHAQQKSDTYSFLAKAVKEAINDNQFYIDLFAQEKILDETAAKFLQKKIVTYELKNLENNNYVASNSIQKFLLENGIAQNPSNPVNIPPNNSLMPDPNDPDDPRHELWHKAVAGIKKAVEKFNKSKLAKDLGIELDKDGSYHVQHGEVNTKTGKPTGYHFEGNDCCFEIETIQDFGKGCEKSVNLTRNGSIPKASSLFPPSWDFEKTIDKILEWSETGSYKVIEKNASKLIRIQSPCCNRIIEIVVESSTGDVLSFYPLMTQLLELAKNKALDCAKCLK